MPGPSPFRRWTARRFGVYAGDDARQANILGDNYGNIYLSTPTTAPAPLPLVREARSLHNRIKEDLDDELGRRQARTPLKLTVRDGAPGSSTEQGGEAHVTARTARDHTLETFVQQFSCTRQRRLILLGEPGSGKSTAAMQLAREMLDCREDTDPVPTVIAMSDWHPEDTHLDTWLKQRISAQYFPGLRRIGWFGRRDLGGVAAKLVEKKLVLPILDGLDELPRGAWHQARRALREILTDKEREFVLVCQSAAAKELIPAELGSADGTQRVTLAPLEPEQAIAFLSRRTCADEARWEPVFRELRREPKGPLAETLTAPLMLDMARVVYESPDTDPAKLADRRCFPSPAALRSHLLDCYVRSEYRRRGAPLGEGERFAPRRRPYPPQAAERWLSFLARHLSQSRTTQLLWWRLPDSVALLDSTAPARLANPQLGPKVLLAGLLALLVGAPLSTLGILGICCFFGWIGSAAAQMLSPRSESDGGLGGLLWQIIDTYQGVDLFVVWLRLTPVIATAQLLGLAGWLTSKTAENQDPIGTVQDELRGDMKLFAARTAATGLVMFLLGMSASMWLEPQRSVASFLLSAGMEPPFDAWLRSLHDAPGLLVGLWGSALLTLTVAIVLAQRSAWGLLLQAAVWLALTRRLPWRPLRFLEDAQSRGVLRRNGSIYEFRHALLQRHLAQPAGLRQSSAAWTVTEAQRLQSVGSRRRAVRMLRSLSMNDPKAREILAGLAEERAVRSTRWGLPGHFGWNYHFHQAAEWWEEKVRQGDPDAVEGLLDLHRRQRHREEQPGLLRLHRLLIARQRELNFWRRQKSDAAAHSALIRTLSERIQMPTRGRVRTFIRWWETRQLESLQEGGGRLPLQATAAPAQEAPPLSLSDTVEQTLRSAFALPGGQPVGTGQLLARLADYDVAADWQRVWLHTGDPSGNGLAGRPDPGPLASAEDIAAVPQPLSALIPPATELTRHAVKSLLLLEDMSRAYPLESVPPGWLALAVLTDPRAGAAQALLESGDLSHQELLECVMDNLLHTRLPGFPPSGADPCAAS